VKKVFFCFIGIAVALPAQVAPTYTWEERVQDYLQRTYGWQRLTVSAANSGLGHLLRDSGDSGPDTFVWRMAASTGRRAVRNTIELGAGALLREDTRFQPSGATGLGARLRYAALQTFRTSGDNPRFAYSRLLGVAGGAAVTPPLYGHAMTGPRFLEDMGMGYLGHLQKSLLTEFGPDLKILGGKMKRKLIP
jgi:hypothetical protein